MIDYKKNKAVLDKVEAVTGQPLTDSERSNVDWAYDYASEAQMSEDEFLADYEALPIASSAILAEVITGAKIRNEKLSEENYRIRHEAAKLVASLPDYCCPKAARDMAVKMVGINNYLQLKVENGYAFNEADKKAMLDILYNAEMPEGTNPFDGEDNSLPAEEINFLDPPKTFLD